MIHLGRGGGGEGAGFKRSNHIIKSFLDVATTPWPGEATWFGPGQEGG